MADVVSSKKSYDSPDKFVGGSPYEQIFQDQDTVIVLYDIPAGDPLPAHQRLLLQGPRRSARRPVGLDLRARRRCLDRLPSAAAVHMEADRRRRPPPVQPLPEERDGGAGGGALGIRRTWTRSAARFSRCRWSSTDAHALGALPLAARQDARVHLRRDAAGERRRRWITRTGRCSAAPSWKRRWTPSN